MKKVLIYIIILLIGIVACDNQEQIFDDFEYKSVYFPYQLPLRTLSLGEDRVDNTLDKAFQFDIGVTIGGMYKNNKDWTVDYVVDNSLTDSVYNSSNGAKILPLPSSYYTLSPLNTITIPKGLYNGRLRVQLTEAFFNDSIAITGQYVVPLRITGTSADSVLSGLAAVPNPDPRIISDWEAGMVPKNWVMFGIKYVNAYHGNYLQRGRDIIYSEGTPVDTVEWRTAHVEKDRVVALSSLGKTKSVTNFIGVNTSGTGEYAMELEFTNMWGTPGGAITITPSPGSNYAVTGSGQYFDKTSSTESIIHLQMQSMHLNYTYDDGTYIHQVSDTLVFRDRGIKFEQNSIVIQE